MKKIIIVLALLVISAALFSQNLTFISNNITYEVYGESGALEKNSVIKIYDNRTVIIQGDETSYLYHITDFEKSSDERYGGIKTAIVLCKDEFGEFWLLGISNIQELKQFIVTIYQDSASGSVFLMFFGVFLEDLNTTKETIIQI